MNKTNKSQGHLKEDSNTYVQSTSTDQYATENTR